MDWVNARSLTALGATKATLSVGAAAAVVAGCRLLVPVLAARAAARAAALGAAAARSSHQGEADGEWQPSHRLRLLVFIVMSPLLVERFGGRDPRVRRPGSRAWTERRAGGSAERP